MGQAAIGRLLAPVLVAAIEQIEQDGTGDDRQARPPVGEAAPAGGEPADQAGRGLEPEHRAARQHDAVDPLRSGRRARSASVLMVPGAPPRTSAAASAGRLGQHDGDAGPRADGPRHCRPAGRPRRSGCCAARAGSPADAQQLQRRQRHHLGRGHQVVDRHELVGLVGEVEDARAVGDAVVQVADAGDVLLVVGAGRADELRPRARARRGSPPATACGTGMRRARSAPAAPPSGRARRSGSPAARAASRSRMPCTSPFTSSSVLLDQEAPVDHQPAAVRHARAGQAVMALGLAAMDRVEVQGRGARALGHHRHRRAALRRAPATARARTRRAPRPCGGRRSRRGTASSRARSGPGSRSRPTRRRDGRGRRGRC